MEIYRISETPYILRIQLMAQVLKKRGKETGCQAVFREMMNQKLARWWNFLVKMDFLPRSFFSRTIHLIGYLSEMLGLWSFSHSYTITHTAKMSSEDNKCSLYISYAFY